MDLEKSLVEIFERAPLRAFGLDELVDALGAPGDVEKGVRRALKKLVHAGRVDREPGHRYRWSRAGARVEGVLRRDPRGRPFVVERGAAKRSDAGAEGLLWAEDADWLEEGDQVSATLVRSERGRVVARIDRIEVSPERRWIGIYHYVGHAHYIEPEVSKKRREVAPVVLAGPPDGVQDGDLVEYRITEPRTRVRGAKGEVVARLGRPGERPAEMRRIAIEFDLPERFPAAVEAEAARFGAAVDPAEAARRRDLRALPIVTIDGEDAKDFDDAVCAEPAGTHTVRVFVAVADVSHYVTPNSALDREALARATSVYLSGTVVPMLPEALSNHLCSLRPHEDRLAFVAEFLVHRDGNVSDASFYRAVIRSHARLTYNQVQAALDGAPDETCGRLLPSLHRLAEVARRLGARRRARGAVDLDVPEAKVVFGPDGLPKEIVRRDRQESHRLIEELMLAANEAVAGYFEDARRPTVYRIHESPDTKKLWTFLQLLEDLGIEPPLGKRALKRPRSSDLNLLLQAVRPHPAARVLEPQLLRVMMQAKYQVENVGHFGLASPRYLHFTSPIRRYPDLIAHRLLGYALAGDDRSAPRSSELELIAEISSKQERQAFLAERATIDLDRAILAAEHVGRELSGIVTSIQSFGLFVAIDEPYIEGLVPIEALGDEFFLVEESGARVVGADSGRAIELGQRLVVSVVRVNFVRRQVELELVGATRRGRDERRPPRRRDGERGRGRSGPPRPPPGGRPKKGAGKPKRPKGRR